VPGFGAVYRVEFLNGGGEVVPGGARRQVQGGGDVVDGRIGARGAQRLDLARAERVRGQLQRRDREPVVDHGLAGGDGADRGGELVHRAVLHEEPSRPVVHGAAHVPRPRERGDDDAPDSQSLVADRADDIETGTTG
jgi:hypothetical protein